MFKSSTIAAILAVAAASLAAAGPYSTHDMADLEDLYPIYNQYDHPIPVDDGRIIEWADNVVSYLPAPGVGPKHDDPVGDIDPLGGIGSLGDLYDETDVSNPHNPVPGETPSEFSGRTFPYGGDPTLPGDEYGFIGRDAVGQITVGFPRGVYNGPGADFAVFENGADYSTGLAADLAYVEVSTDGVDFARFPGISDNTDYLQNPFGTPWASIDLTNVYNLAGKHLAGWGTPFDLDDLITDPLVVDGTVKLDDIQYLRLIDIPGVGHTVNVPGVGPVDYLDSQGNNIIDAWPTMDSGGFDFHLDQGVGVINPVPEPGTLALLAVAGLVLAVLRRRSL